MQIKFVILAIIMSCLTLGVKAQTAVANDDANVSQEELLLLYSHAFSLNPDEAIPAAERIYGIARKRGWLTEMFNTSLLLSTYYGHFDTGKKKFWNDEALRLLDVMDSESRKVCEALYMQLNDVIPADGNFDVSKETDLLKLRGRRTRLRSEMSYKESLAVAKRIVDLQEQSGIKDTTEYISDLADLGSLYGTNLNDSAFEVLHKAMRLSVNHGGHRLQELLDSYVLLCIRMQYVERGMIVSDKQLELLRKKYGDNSVHVYNALRYRGLLYILGHKYGEAINAYLQAFDVQWEIVRQRFPYITEEERHLYWMDNFHSFENIANLVFTYSSDAPAESMYKAYDQQLLSKGMLLNASNGIRRELERSPELMAKWKRLNAIKQTMSYLGGEQLIQTELAANQMERELAASTSLEDYARTFSITSKDIHAVLKAGDVAVEFLVTELKDGPYLACVILDSEHPAPSIVMCCSIRNLMGAFAGDYDRDTKVYDMLWSTLTAFVPNARNIYFSPADVLNTLPVEYCMTDNGMIMSERYNMYRVSSTRELVTRRPRQGNRIAAIYGGIDYSAGVKSVVSDARKYPEVMNSDLVMRGGNVIRDWTQEIKPLANTLTEAENIMKVLKDRYTPFVFKDVGASEASLKSLSGRSPQILHIATHGFFWDERKRAQYSGLGMMRTDDNPLARYEDKALSHSGLLFAGALNAMKNVTLPDGVDDGVCTAAEISRLDLSSTDLVVLSACDSGLGELSGDGIFGLQRGFKKAGVNSILMSLWSVNDRATMLLMTEFYRNLASGRSKMESLRAAQRYLRGYNNGYYSAKEHWAGFVLVDGL